MHCGYSDIKCIYITNYESDVCFVFWTKKLTSYNDYFVITLNIMKILNILPCAQLVKLLEFITEKRSP